MGLVRRTDKSDLDLRNIHRYIAADNRSAADGMLRQFQQKLSMLADMPGAGPAQPDLGKDVRSWPVGKYLLFYRPIENGVELLRVIHGARKVKRVFRRGEP